MNISQRLRTCARHTGLDAVIELLNEAADEIERLSDAQPADVTDEQCQAFDQIMEQAQVFASAWALVGGRFDSGDALDDAHEAKEELRKMVARAILALRPVQEPMTDEMDPLFVKGALSGIVDAQVRDLWPTKSATRPSPGVQDALKDHQIAAMVNTLRDIARQFHGHDSLRERIANVLVPALKAEAQQPATTEPVVDVRCEGCGYMTHHREHMGCVRAAKQHTHPAQGVPEFSRIAKRKLDELQEQGFAITGYAIQRGPVRGFIDGGGFVGWWQGEPDPGVPADVARDAERWRVSELISKAALKHPDSRTEAENTAFNAYRASISSGNGYAYCIDAAMIASTAQKGGE